MDRTISEAIRSIGVQDEQIRLFENQYRVPRGISYNSYLILDEKTALLDMVDASCCGEWEENLKAALAGRRLDYLVISHLEPDHSGSIKRLLELCPEVKLVGNAKTFSMLPQFLDVETEGRSVVVKEGDSLSLGTHRLTFYLALMVHWPEVMVSYESSEKILFSADAFGRFGTPDADEPWEDEARRYYVNIVGKYGAPVQTLLKKAAGLDIQTICPLHGPVLRHNLGHYLGLYDTWSSYRPEERGVLIACASIHGNTWKAAQELAEMLRGRGEENVALYSLAGEEPSQAVAEAFRYDRMIVAASSYDGGVFPCMQEFLQHLQSKMYQNRRVGIVENGSWGPTAARAMRQLLEGMKDITILEPVVTIKSTLSPESRQSLERLAEAILQ